MPTSRPRHTITETEPVQQALDDLRALTDERIDLAKLVVVGARATADRLRREDERTRSARRELGQMIRSGELPATDLTAAENVRRLRLEP